MKARPLLSWLIPVTIILAGTAALAGLLYPFNGSPYLFTTLHGQLAQIDGRGLYRFDTLFSAATFRATDVVTLLIGLPLLIAAFTRYRKGSLKGALILAGVLAYFVYLGASMAFGAAFNRLFLVYTALLSVSLLAFLVVLTSIPYASLEAHVLPGFPWRGASAFMFICGLGILLIWLSELVDPLLTGSVPGVLGPYTTLFTYAFDLAIITPAAVLTGVFLHRRNPRAIVAAAVILILCTLNGILVVSSTVAQNRAGITFPIGAYVGLIGSWVILAGAAILLTVLVIGHLRDTSPIRTGTHPEEVPMEETLSDEGAAEITATWQMLNPP